MTEDIDKIISAELPNEDEDPLLFKIVMESMIHGPCVGHNEKCPCIVEKKCSKHFPKEICAETCFDKDGFTKYKRTMTNTAMKKGCKIDSTWVVPHNPALLKEYNAHINVEFCNRSRMIKYLFKYMSKGQDRGTAVIEENQNSSVPPGYQEGQTIDEIQMFLDCRYVSAPEACWRIFGFEIHYRNPPVERLSFHPENEQLVRFRDNDNLAQVANRETVKIPCSLSG